MISPRPRVLVLCLKYSVDKASPSLVDELARSLCVAGCDVRICLLNWSGDGSDSAGEVMDGTIRIRRRFPLSIEWGPLAFRKLVKWVGSSLAVASDVLRECRWWAPDAVVAFSPASAMALPILFATWRIPKSLFVLWDFFPIHHAEIGVLTLRFLEPILKTLEQLLIRRFTLIGCMSEANSKFLGRYFRLRAGQRVELIRLWTSRPSYLHRPKSLTRSMYGLPSDRVLFVFGGQFVLGRGIEDILSAAALIKTSCPRAHFVFVGDGPLLSLVEDASSGAGCNVSLLPKVSRDEYLAIATACDCGLVCTVRDVSVPTFPSKSLDYLHAGLPILASVEGATDFGDFVTSERVGLSVEAGDVSSLVDAVALLTDRPDLRQSFADNVNQCLESHFSADGAARRVCELLDLRS